MRQDRTKLLFKNQGNENGSRKKVELEAYFLVRSAQACIELGNLRGGLSMCLCTHIHWLGQQATSECKRTWLIWEEKSCCGEEKAEEPQDKERRRKEGQSPKSFTQYGHFYDFINGICLLSAICLSAPQGQLVCQSHRP